MRILAIIAVTSACAPQAALKATATSWPAADKLFENDARFLGADSAYSVSLGDGRVLWLFGDTFVALDETRSRQHAKMVRNSIAIEAGLDPSTATVQFFFGGTATAPDSFFVDGSADQSKSWLWPGTPVVVDGKLVVLLWNMRTTSEPGAFGFVLDHTSAIVVDNPGDDPTAWHRTSVNVPKEAATIGTGGAFVDDKTVRWLSAREPGDHEMFAASAVVDDVARGDFSKLSVVDARFHGQTEVSLSKARGQFVQVAVDGFGNAPVTLRTARAVEGPWSSPLHVFDAPEGKKANALVYSAKAHPELHGADLVVTYCTNDSDFATLVDDTSLYFPRFLKVTLE